MATIEFRANLNAAKFPFISDFFGRSIIVGRFDQNFPRTAGFSGKDEDRDLGIPQVFYMHNVLPTEQGFMSVGYNTQLLPFTPTIDDFDRIFLIRNAVENHTLFSPAQGKNYTYDANSLPPQWKSISPLTPGAFPFNGLVSQAFVNGRTFVCYEHINMFEYDFTTQLWNPVPLTGLTMNLVRGICASTNYLIAFDDANTIYWSSLVNPIDMVPSLVTGAGSSNIQEIRGKITAVLPINNGYVIYTTENAVLATFSGNVRFPWIFREIAGSGGIVQPDHAAYDANISSHYAWTTKGFMRIDKTGVEVISSDVTDFLGGKIFEDFDATTQTLITETLSSPLSVKVTLIASRYVVISYGKTTQLTHALVLDISNKRWGKFKVNHVDCFQYSDPNFFGSKTYDGLAPRTYDDLSLTTYDQLSQQQVTSPKPRADIAFLQKDGTILIVDLKFGSQTRDGLFLLGKFQLTRGHAFSIQTVDVENTDVSATNFIFDILTSFNGKFFDRTTTPRLIEKAGQLSSYGCKGVTGLNHTLRYRGAFNLCSVTMLGAQHGIR